MFLFWLHLKKTCIGYTYYRDCRRPEDRFRPILL